MMQIPSSRSGKMLEAVLMVVAFAFLSGLSGCENPSTPAAPLSKESIATHIAAPEVELIEQARSAEGVEVCWSTQSIEACTLSILHASGEGDFFDVEPRGCYVVTREAHTLVEIFCRGAAGDANGLLHLVDEEGGS